MSVYKHYKMFKKGKNWCCMAIATLSVAVGALSLSQHNVNADTTETEASSISTNIENTQNLSENTVQNQDLQTKTADASTTQNINKSIRTLMTIPINKVYLACPMARVNNAF